MWLNASFLSRCTFCLCVRVLLCAFAFRFISFHFIWMINVTIAIIYLLFSSVLHLRILLDGLTLYILIFFSSFSHHRFCNTMQFILFFKFYRFSSSSSLFHCFSSVFWLSHFVLQAPHLYWNNLSTLWWILYLRSTNHDFVFFISTFAVIYLNCFIISKHAFLKNSISLFTFSVFFIALPQFIWSLTIRSMIYQNTSNSEKSMANVHLHHFLFF